MVVAHLDAPARKVDKRPALASPSGPS